MGGVPVGRRGRQRWLHSNVNVLNAAGPYNLKRLHFKVYITSILPQLKIKMSHIQKRYILLGHIPNKILTCV